MGRSIKFLIVFMIMASQVSSGMNFVVNGGFETLTNIQSLPNDYGYWGYDPVEIVTTSQGITPFGGSQMLRFLYTYPTGPAGTIGCDLYQIINVTSFMEDIRNGNAVAKMSTVFNRVAGDNETDSEFIIQILAYSGSPNSFPSQFGSVNSLGFVRKTIITDNDISTWEPLSVELNLPENTDFVVVYIAAAENVYNDTSNVEFDGHYADAVYLDIVPEPASLLLFGLGALMLKRK